MNHNNVVKLYEYTETQEDYILFLEYCNKADYLANKILEVRNQIVIYENRQCHTPVNNNIKLQAYVADILEGLRYIHNQGVIHDDIKLENILTQKTERDDEFNQLKICDFGLSHIMDPKLNWKARIEARCGTLGYIAPEVKEV